MSGGEAFVILAAADIRVRERRARRSRSTRSEWSPFFGSIYKFHTPVDSSASAGLDLSRSSKLLTRSWIEILVAVGASLVVASMVAAGGVAAARDIADAALTGERATIEPDPLTICRSIKGQTVCVREPT